MVSTDNACVCMCVVCMFRERCGLVVAKHTVWYFVCREVRILAVERLLLLAESYITTVEVGVPNEYFGVRKRN